MSSEEKDVFSIIGRLPGYTKLMIKLYKSSDVRKKHKLLLSMGIAYSMSPIELIPGIIPVAGQLDNILVILRCLKKVLEALNVDLRAKYLQDTGITIEQIDEDIKLAGDTLKAIGNGTVKLFKNCAKFAGYSALYGYRKLRRKKPF